MGSKWQEYRLDEVTELIVDCPHSTPEWTDTGVVVLRSFNIKNGRLDLSSPSYTNEEGFQNRIKRAVPKEGDLVLTREAPMGEVCQIPAGLTCCLGQRMVLIRANKKIIDPDYLLYVLQSPYLQHQINWNEGTGTTVSNIRIPNIQAFKIPTPPLFIQRNIATGLKNLDQKITLNRQINQTLEQMAQTLFKSWFVDFDPVIDNALDAGNEIPELLQTRAELRQKIRASQDFQPLPADIRALFPAEFEESELGWVPKGWEVDSLNSVASYTSDRVDISELNLNNYISTENMLSDRQGVCSASSLPTVQTVPSYSTGHILISNIRPYFKKIWFAHGTGGRSNDVLGFSANQAGTEDYLYNLLYQDVFFDFMMTTSKGSKMPRGDKDAIMDWLLVIPSMELRRFYSLKCKASRSFGEMHRNENRTLEQLRDTLLPKLISGELRLDEITSP